MRQHFLNRDADASTHAVRADQIIANLAVAAEIRRIAERFKTDLKLTMLTAIGIPTKRAVWPDSFEKPGRFSVADRDPPLHYAHTSPAHSGT